MANVCPSCAAESPLEFRFCGFCGAALQAAPTRSTEPVTRRSSRRHVTVLFADLANYTRAAQSTDPEKIYFTIRSTLEQLSQVVAHYGGRVDRYAGDGFLATFGVPQAHEDDPTRALLAALDMQRTMQKLQEQAFASLGWETQLRVGVNVGAAISGHLDTGLLHDTSVFGHSVNLASRLQEAARPGTILVSEAIYRRCRSNFAFSDPIKLQLKGIDRPVVGYELVTRRAPSHHETRVPFIGRTMHYEVLVEALQHVKTDGRGITVLVTGEPGVGKSRLVAETLAPLEEHFQIVQAECSPTEGRSYSVIAQLLAGLAGADPYDSLEARQRALDELLVGSPVAEVGPFLHVLLSGEDTRTSGKESGSPPDTVRSAVRLLLAWQARRRAPLFVVDDLQWSDTASLQILASVTNLIREVAGALIIIARAEFRPRLAKVFGEHEPLHLELDPLPVAETDELLAALLEGCTVPHALRQELVSRSAGVPLLLTELVRMLADAGVFREGETDPHWHKVIQGVPDSVNGLILSRYDQLPTDAKALLEAAAVLGPWFTPTQLADITNASEKEVGQQLEVLETDNFVRSSSRAGATRYYFQHTLLREAIYETLLLDERRALHGRAAEILQRTEPDASAALIGHHLERAGSADAAAFLKQAGEQAAACFANEEAEGFYRRAQALLEPPNMTTPEEHVDLALRLADLMLHTGQLEAAEEQLTKAADFNHRAGDIFFYTGQLKTLQGAYDEALAAFQATRSALADTPHTCRAFDIADLERETGWIAYHQGAFTSAKHYAERALGYAQKSANTAGVASAYNLLTPALYWAGELEAAAESGRQALELRERMGDIWGAARTQNNLGHILHRLGKWAEAEAYLRQALFVQREIGDRQGELLSLNNLGLLLTEAGRVLEALEQLDHAIRYLKSGEFAPAIQCQLHINRALAFLLDGQAQAAFADLQVSLATTEEGDNTDIRALTEAYLAEAQLAVGDTEDAWDSYERSQQLAGAHAPREVRAELLTVNAHLLRATGDLHGALNACRAARAIVDELGSHYEYARLQVETAEIQLALGEAPDEALVRDALRTLQALPARADVARAEGVLLQLGVTGDRAWPTVVVHLKPELDGAVEKDTQDQETLVTAQGRILRELRRSGHVASALVTQTGPGISYVLTGPEQDATAELVSRAAQTAQQALETLARFNRSLLRELGRKATLRIGIAVGLWPRPSAEATHLAIFANSSQAGRQAAAMADASAPNAIALSAEAATFLQDSYDLKPLEPGRDRRLPAAVLNLGRARGDHQIPVGFPTTSKELIGRATERVQLEAWLDNRRGGVCYLEAEAGMGKTRLVEHLVSHAKPDLHVLTGKCEPYRNGVSYAPLVDILSGVQTPDTPASRQLQCMLGLRPPANASERALVDLEPPDLRGELFGCVHEHLATLCFERPVLLIVEDIHWLDLSTLDLIEFLLPFVLDAPIKLLLVARAEMPGPHRALIRKAARVSGDRYMQVSFGGLSKPDSMALMRDLLQTPSLPVGLWPLLTKCAGHPLSLEESLRYLIEHGWLLRVGQNWQLAKHVGALPSEFRDLLLGRLERLDGETLHVLQAAAVLGEMFERAVLNRVTPGSDLSRRLRELEERGWLLAVNDRRTQYRFKHTLTREIIYATLLASKRQVLHQRAGEALEALYQDADEHVELLAQHFAGSALREKSIRYQVQAGQKSAARQALAEALAFYQGALESLDGAASPWRLQIALGLADVHLARGEPNSIIEALTQLLDDGLAPAQRAACLLRLGAAQRDIGELDAALQHFTAALELAPKQERPALLLGRAQTHFDRHELEAAESYALQVLEDTGPGLRAEALGLLGGIAYRRGDIQTAADHVAQSLALHRGRGNRGGAAAAYANLGVLAAMQDDPVAARDNFTLSLELRTALGDAHGTAVVCNNLGQLEQKSGNLEAAGQYLEQAIKIARHAELARVLVQSLANLGAVQTEAGQLEAARAYLDEAETLGRRYGFDDLRYETLCHRAAWAVEVGDYVTAGHDAREALAGAQDLEAVDLVAKVRRILEHIPQGSDIGADATIAEFDADSVERGQ